MHSEADEAEFPAARSVPEHDGRGTAPRAPRPPQRADDAHAARHDARYWEAVDRLDFFDPAG